MKYCWKCKQNKEFIEFGQNRSKPDGLSTECKPCKRKQDNEYAARNREAAKQRARNWYYANKDSFTEQQKQNFRLAEQRYRKRHPDRLNAKNRRREARKLNATPAWADKVAIDYMYYVAKVIERVYGTKLHVDHIIPLRGKTVCGLHVHNNLQLLAPLDNIRKSNKLGGY
jgi:hypothetical protein